MNSIFNRGHVGTGGREIFDGREWDVVNFYPSDFRVVPEAGKINLKPARGDVNDNAEWEFVLVEPERCYSDRSRCMVACRKSSSELGRGGELRGHRQDFAVSGSGASEKPLFSARTVRNHRGKRHLQRDFSERGANLNIPGRCFAGMVRLKRNGLLFFVGRPAGDPGEVG